jgi:hypothetical protein
VGNVFLLPTLNLISSKEKSIILSSYKWWAAKTRREPYIEHSSYKWWAAKTRREPYVEH